jgi:hypothetical protein
VPPCSRMRANPAPSRRRRHRPALSVLAACAHFPRARCSSDEIILISDEIMLISDEIILISDEITFISDKITLISRKLKLFHVCKVCAIFDQTVIRLININTRDTYGGV